MNQSPLFDLEIKRHQRARGNGRDIRIEGVAVDGMEYALKRAIEHPLLPATERFCYQLAQTCSLPVPYYATLKDLDGARVFGSRIEGNVSELDKLPPEEAIHKILGCEGRMSACYAMDLFIANEDRHFGNFVFREMSSKVVTAMPIDYSRAWWVHGWPPQLDPVRHNATTHHIGVMREIGKWASAEAALTLGRIGSIKRTDVENLLRDMPEEWLDNATRATTLAWWESPDFHAHIQACMNFCSTP